MTGIVDSGPGLEPQTSDPAPSTEPMDTMGAGLLGEDNAPTQPEADATEQPEAVEGTTTEAPAEDAGTTETTATTELSADERLKSWQADYTRKTQDLADERRAFQAEMQQQREAFNSERQELINAFQQAQQGGDTDALQQLASNLPPADAQGLAVVDQLIAERIKAALDPLTGDVSQIKEQFGEAQGAVSQLTQAQQAAMVQKMQAQVGEANEAFGEDVVRATYNTHQDLIEAYTKATNPSTGQPWTLKEAVGQITGKTAELTAQAREQSHNGQVAAKNGAAGAPVGSGPAQQPSTGSISEAQAKAELAKLFGA